MAHQVLSPRPASRIAVTVMGSGPGATPCPFFGRCDGIAVLDAGAREFRPNPLRTPESLCDLILAAGVDGLVCGFITEPEIRRLRAAGVDVRLGSGRYSIEELAARFCDLPEA